MNTAASPVNPPAAAPAAPAAVSAAAHCENCGAPVTEKYCGSCGQRVEAPVHSLWHFAQVAAEDLTHADSRLWRTLAALLFRPGFLTREFLAGRRARYLPPVRLYLVLSLAFFLWASVAPNRQLLEISVSEQGTPSAAMAPVKGAKGTRALCLPGEAPEQCAQRVCNNSAYEGPWRHFVVTTGHQVCVRSVLDGGKSVHDAFLHNVPRAMFLFLPLLAVAMMLMYWRPRHYYVEHLLLFVHNHAFVFLLLLLAGLVSALLTGLASALPAGRMAALLPRVSGLVDLAVTLYIAWYAYRSMRVVYGQSRWLTVGKLAVLSFFYLVAGSLMLALTSVYSALTL